MHTFTYKHSDLPALRPEIKAEIVALGLRADDLTLKSRGNYRELQELAEALNDCLNACELNLNSIRIIPDDGPPPAPISFKDLPIEEKRLLYSCSMTNSILLNLLSEIVGKPPEELARDIAIQASIQQKPVEAKEIEEFIETMMMPLVQGIKKHGSDKVHYVFKVMN